MDLWEVWDGLNLENQLYRARGVVALVAPIQCSTGWWLEVLQCLQTCGLILLTGSLTATKTGGAPLLGLLSVLRLKKQIPTNPISWSPIDLAIKCSLMGLIPAQLAPYFKICHLLTQFGASLSNIYSCIRLLLTLNPKSLSTLLSKHRDVFLCFNE